MGHYVPVEGYSVASAGPESAVCHRRRRRELVGCCSALKDIRLRGYVADMDQGNNCYLGGRLGRMGENMAVQRPRPRIDDVFVRGGVGELGRMSVIGLIPNTVVARHAPSQSCKKKEKKVSRQKAMINKKDTKTHGRLSHKPIPIIRPIWHRSSCSRIPSRVLPLRSIRHLTTLLISSKWVSR